MTPHQHTITDVPVTLARITRALVGKMLRTMTHEQIADAFGVDRSHVTKYLDPDNTETRTITFAHLEAYAEKIGGRALIAELNGIAANMPEDSPSRDELHRGEERDGPRRGRPPKGTSRITAVGGGTVRPVPLPKAPATLDDQPADEAETASGIAQPNAKQRRIPKQQQ